MATEKAAGKDQLAQVNAQPTIVGLGPAVQFLRAQWPPVLSGAQAPRFDASCASVRVVRRHPGIKPPVKIKDCYMMRVVHTLHPGSG